MAARPAMILTSAMPANSPVVLYPTRAPWNPALGPVVPGVELELEPEEPPVVLAPEVVVDVIKLVVPFEEAPPTAEEPPEADAPPEAEAPPEADAPPEATTTLEPSPGGNPVGVVRGVLAKPSNVVVATASAESKVSGIPLETVA